MLSSSNPKFVVRLPLRDETNVAVLQTTKAAKQNAIRKTITKNGEWLTTKAAPVKRKNAATAKPKPVKKTKVKPTKKPVSKVATKTKPAKTRTTGASAEVIELSSDEDDSEPDVPLISLRQMDKPDDDDMLWNDDNDDDTNNKASDDEYEFEE